MVEHIFALAVALGIGRRDRRGLAVGAVERDRQRLPAGAGADAARFLEDGQEGVAEKRILGAGTGIPFVGGEGRDALTDAGANLPIALTHAATRS